MAEALRTRRLNPEQEDSFSDLGVTTGGLPPLNNLPDDSEGWLTFSEPILYVYAGKGPYVGRLVVINGYSSCSLTS